MAFKKNENKESEFNYKVTEDYGKISDRNGWELRLREVSFNGKPAKYDIRTWKSDEEGEKMGKGIQLSGEELESLCEILNKIREA